MVKDVLGMVPTVKNSRNQPDVHEIELKSFGHFPDFLILRFFLCENTVLMFPFFFSYHARLEGSVLEFQPH